MFDELKMPMPEKSGSPRHGDQGNRVSPGKTTRIPRSLSIALSRESGARGATIARRVGEQLGWQVYSQDLLEHSVQDELVRQNIIDTLNDEASAWVKRQLSQSPVSDNRERHPLAVDLVRMVLTLGTAGEVIIIGRGAGYILPRESTLHIRLVAPRQDRVAYLSQWMRLTQEEAEKQVARRDQRRNLFVQEHFGRSPVDVHNYDLILNTSYVGEDLATLLIIEAARHKLERWIECADIGESEEH